MKRLSGLEQSISEDNEQKLNFLYNAIQDTQETIKFTDTKSGTIFVLGTAFITAIVTLVKSKLVCKLPRSSNGS